MYLRGRDDGDAQSTLIAGDPDGGVDLYYDGIKTFGTWYLNAAAIGTKTVAADGSGFITRVNDGGDVSLYADQNSATVSILSYHDGAAQNYLFNGDPDGSVDLYYDGLKTFETHEDGITCRDGDGAAPYLLFTSSAGAAHGTIQMTPTLIDIQLSGEAMIHCHADSSIELYYDGTVKCETTSTGFGPATAEVEDLGTNAKEWEYIYSLNVLQVTSDERKKEQLDDSLLGLEFIDSLRPRKWKWKDTEDKKHKNHKHTGLVAQEVQQAMTELGIDDQDIALVNYDEETDSYSLGMGELIAPMIKAIQELKQEIEEIKKWLKNCGQTYRPI